MTKPAGGQSSHRWPEFLPDGRRFLFYESVGLRDTRGVYLGELNGNEPRRILDAEEASINHGRFGRVLVFYERVMRYSLRRPLVLVASGG